MARYKSIDTSPRFLAVDLERQLLPGSFEHALHHLIDRHLDLSGFDARYRNDRAGAAAYPPGLLLKVVLFAYSQGIVSSRGIERACREHVTFIALAGDSAPHFTTIAAFVSGLGDEIARLFSQVLCLCDRQGLIGRAMFAIDGVKLPSNAAKGKSGTRADFTRQLAKLEAAAHAMVARHRENDTLPAEAGWAMEALLPGAQHREAGASRVWAVGGGKGPEGRRCLSVGAVNAYGGSENGAEEFAPFFVLGTRGKGVLLQLQRRAKGCRAQRLGKTLCGRNGVPLSAGCAPSMGAM